MPRTFIAITQEDIDLRVAESIKAREFELLGYDFEKAGHEAVIAEIEAKNLAWTKETEKYKGLTRDQLIQSAMRDQLSAEVLNNLADLTRLDFAKANLAAVKIETSRSESHYAHAIASLPEERRADALLALKTKEEAAKAV
jgi:trans-2-enoyl-CoA reductase